MSYLDKVTVGGATYDIADSEARAGVDELKSAISNVSEGCITFSIIDGEYISTSDGSVLTNASYARSDYISCKGMDYIHVMGYGTSGQYSPYNMFYDAQKQAITPYFSINQDKVISVPANAEYFRISGEKSKGFNNVKVMNPLGSMAANFDLSQIVYKALVNSQPWMANTYVKADGTYASHGNWDAIEIEPAGDYVITNANCNGGGYMVFLDAGGEVLASYNGMGNVPRVYAVPTGTKKIRTCYEKPQAVGVDVFIIGGKLPYDALAIKALDERIPTSVERKLAVIGDSISSNNATGQVPVNYLAWPTMLIEKNKCHTEYQNLTYPGKRLYNGLISDCESVTSDTDIVVVALGRNDIGRGYAMGDVSEIMALPLEEVTTDSIMGVYRKGLETLKNRLKDESIIVCIAPVTDQLIDSWEDSTNPSWHDTWAEFDAMRTAFKEFVVAEGGAAHGWFYINGRDIFEVSEDALNLYYGFKADGTKDNTHPNICGQAVIASTIYNTIPPIGAIMASNYITS